MTRIVALGDSTTAGTPGFLSPLEAPPDGDPAGERFLEVRPYVDFARLSTVAVVVAGREEDGQFGDGEVIDTGPLVDAPTVTVTPDPDAPAVPGLDFPAPTVTETGSPAPTASPGG